MLEHDTVYAIYEMIKSEKSNIEKLDVSKILIK